MGPVLSPSPLREERAGERSHSIAAFSLIELMITMALLTFIVFGLLAMFTQTQRAFRNSMNSVDVTESGRAVIDILTHEIEQLTPSRMPFTTNFFTQLEGSFSQPLLQGMPGTAYPGNPNAQDVRTNVVQRFFFLTQVNQDWIGTGYEVLSDYANSGVGTLYRFTTNRTPADYKNYGLTASTLSGEFLQAPTNRLSRIADGIVHLRLRAFDTNGMLINLTNNIQGTFRYTNGIGPDQFDYYFLSNAVPGSIEIELGIIEPNIVQRFKSIATPVAQRNYLSNHVAQVHVFRQRIPVRNIDFVAYQ
jgi:type II secretory pathway component PulJ